MGSPRESIWRFPSLGCMLKWQCNHQGGRLISRRIGTLVHNLQFHPGFVAKTATESASSADLSISIESLDLFGAADRY